MCKEPKVAGVCAMDVGEEKPESGLKGEGKDGPRDGGTVVGGTFTRPIMAGETIHFP